MVVKLMPQLTLQLHRLCGYFDSLQCHEWQDELSTCLTGLALAAAGCHRHLLLLIRVCPLVGLYSLWLPCEFHGDGIVARHQGRMDTGEAPTTHVHVQMKLLVPKASRPLVQL